MSLERNFQSTALKYLNSLKGCMAENQSGNAAQSGRADIVGCYKGRMFRLELKVPDHKNDVTDLQRLELRKWKRCGCIVGVVYSMEAIKRLFEVPLTDKLAKVFTMSEENGCVSWAEIPGV